jgi:hypothetical protein
MINVRSFGGEEDRREYREGWLGDVDFFLYLYAFFSLEAAKPLKPWLYGNEKGGRMRRKERKGRGGTKEIARRSKGDIKGDSNR